VVGVVRVPARVSLILAVGDPVPVLPMLLRSAIVNVAMSVDTSAAFTASASTAGTECVVPFSVRIIYNDL
jgi:hypothetical protein